MKTQVHDSDSGIFYEVLHKSGKRSRTRYGKKYELTTKVVAGNERIDQFSTMVAVE